MNVPSVFKRDYMQTAIMIAAVILAVLVFWYGLSFVFGTDNPVLAVASGSMEPVLYKGDLIVVEGIQNLSDIYAAPHDADPPGDIVVYQGRQLIVHRVIDKKNATDGSITFIFHGDANTPGVNEQVNEDQIVGRYVGFKIPLLGHIALFFDSFEMKVAFIALWIVILVIVELAPSIKKRLNRGSNGERL